MRRYMHMVLAAGMERWHAHVERVTRMYAVVSKMLGRGARASALVSFWQWRSAVNKSMVMRTSMRKAQAMFEDHACASAFTRCVYE